MAPDFLEDFDQIGASKFPEVHNYLNQFVGLHKLQVTRFERSKTGRAVIAEFDEAGTPFSHVFKLDTDVEWKREQTIRELRQLAGAALKTHPRKITLKTLFTASIVGSTVLATVEPNKNGFKIVKFTAA